MGLLSTLLPSRNALFELRLEIMDLANVPLVSGAFGTEWRFRKTRSAAGSGRKGTLKGKGKQREGTEEHDLERGRSTSSLHPTVSRSTTARSSSTSSSTSSSSSTHSQHSSKHHHSHRLPKPHLPGTDLGSISHKGRGETTVVDIVDHACRWDQVVIANVRIPVESPSGSGKGKEREKEDSLGLLGERELHLSVHQYNSPDDPVRVLRLGHLTLNLAEYAGRGPVSRRYLLDSGKTNATLKLEIELTQIGGQKKWLPPPITKGQLANGGLETLVNGSAATNMNEGAFHSKSSLNLSSSTSAGTSAVPSRARTPEPVLTNINVGEPRAKQGFIVPTGTEAIIEALFNPFPSTVAGPFSYKAPPRPSRRPTELSFEDTAQGHVGLEVPATAQSAGQRRKLNVKNWRHSHHDTGAKESKRDRSRGRERSRSRERKEDVDAGQACEAEALQQNLGELEPTDVEEERGKNR